MFDGSRAAFLLNVTAPNLHNGEYNNGKKVVKLSSDDQGRQLPALNGEGVIEANLLNFDSLSYRRLILKRRVR